MSPTRHAMFFVLALGFSFALSAQDAGRLIEEYGSEVTVYGDRLPLTERRILDTPAPVTVVTREEIEASGASTLQEVLAALPGVFLHDQTGNPAESTVDVRGFPQGTSAVVFLDGVRLNNLEDNGSRWEILPLEEIERIEVYRGAAAPLYGGGALAAVVNVVTRRGAGIPRLDLTASAGSFGERSGRVHSSGEAGPVGWHATAMRRKARGYRENDGHRFDDALLNFSYHVGDNRKLSFLLKSHEGTLSNPGALTEEEMEEDRRQSPFNLYDGSRGRHRLAVLSLHHTFGEGLALSGQAYVRRHERDTLTAGRFGMGFETNSREKLAGFLFEARGTRNTGGWTLGWSGGAEAARGNVSAEGFFTAPDGGNPLPASSNSARQRPWGLFLQGSAGKGIFEASAGFRRDGARYEYRDRFAPANGVDRVFQANTGRASILLRTSESSSAFVTFAQGFRIPSVIDLFAYPGFFSNPALEPTRASDWEGGWRYLDGGRRFQATLFSMRMRDEVVFVLTNPDWFIGQNRNVGRSTRKGAELEGAWPLGEKVSLFGSAALLTAKVTAGPQAGERVPMVPERTASAGVQFRATDWLVRMSGSYVGRQWLDNDLENVRGRLGSYFTVDLSARYAWRGLTLEAAVRNALGREYASRGITNGFQDYYTPARPLSASLAVTWSF